MDNNFNRDYNKEVETFFGDRFTATSTMSRFEVMLDHFSKKFEIDKDQVNTAYEKAYKSYDESKVVKFSGYFAAICKGMSNRVYTQEQTMRYIDFNVKQRKDEQLEDFINKYDAGERRVFAPSFGITKKEHNDMAYMSAKTELESRQNHLPVHNHAMEKAPAI